MADVFSLGAYSDAASYSSDGTSKDTGDLRRRYNFGDRVSELAIAQDPFFRFVSKVAKKPTDDPEFKFTERRPSYHKRYAYVMGAVDASGADYFGDSEIIATNDAGSGTSVAQGDTVKLYMAGDYKSAGNLQNVYGNTDNDWSVGASGTRPAFFLQDQVVKIPMTSATDGTLWGKDYILVKISAVTDSLSKDSKECVLITGIVIKASSSCGEFAGWHTNNFSPSGDSAGDEVVADKSIADDLESARSYVVGSAHGQGSGYPETWKDQPFSTGFGLTQIWKTSMAMDNTTRATVLKYEPNEFARIWREKLIEHKWDIETSLLFGAQGSVNSVQYTEGAVDFITGYGNIFSGSGMTGTGTKAQDDFLQDMSNYLDPRYNNSSATLFMVSTDCYNWLHKLSGYFTANVKKTDAGSANHFAARTDFSIGGKKNVFGLDITQIYTPYGVMNVTRNCHLDGTAIKMLGINMKHCKYRPLVGNGLNRDTAVYVGVQTLENSGVDRRVDLIQTEAGMQWEMPEAHAVWK
jgi:hypothetical protein